MSHVSRPHGAVYIPNSNTVLKRVTYNLKFNTVNRAIVGQGGDLTDLLSILPIVGQIL